MGTELNLLIRTSVNTLINQHTSGDVHFLIKINLQKCHSNVMLSQFNPLE